jgi:hypothetical protein
MLVMDASANGIVLYCILYIVINRLTSVWFVNNLAIDHHGQCMLANQNVLVTCLRIAAARLSTMEVPIALMQFAACLTCSYVQHALQPQYTASWTAQSLTNARYQW